MINFKNRVPADGKANRKKLTFDNGTVQYAKVEFADDASVVGTPINRERMLALQGYNDSSTLISFGDTIGIAMTNEDGSDATDITFGSDGGINISNHFTGGSGDTAKSTNKISFLTDGSIKIESKVTG